MKKGETTGALFNSVTLANVMEGQIDDETLNIPVKSYAIQAEHIGGIQSAIRRLSNLSETKFIGGRQDNK